MGLNSSGTAISALARTALALAFLVFTSWQPSMALPSGMLSKGMYGQLVFDPAAASEKGHPHENMAGDTSHDASHDHAAPADADDKSCEIHCAPLHAVPVECPSVVQPGDCGHAAAGNAVLRHGEYAEFVKPPRS